MQIFKSALSIVLVSTFATYTQDVALCSAHHCWFSHTNNPVVKVELKSLNKWYHVATNWIRKTETTTASDQKTTVLEEIVPILKIVPVNQDAWEPTNLKTEQTISGYNVTPYAYETIKRIPQTIAYVMKENFDTHKEIALNFLACKKEYAKRQSLSILLDNYEELVKAKPTSYWHENCTGYIVPMETVLAITALSSIAHTQNIDRHQKS